MTRKTILLSLVILFTSVPIIAQQNDQQPKAFNNIDLNMTAGTTGIGVELSTKLSKVVGIRAGFSFMPHFLYNMHFTAQVGDTPESKYDEQGNRVETKFDKLQATMKDYTGFTVDEDLTMEARPKFYNFSVLVDVHPFKNKNWYLTGGIYWGNSTFADSQVSQDDMITTLAVGLYNNMYTKSINNEPFYHVNNMDVYNEEMAERFISYGRMHYSIGTLKSTGEQCYIEPDEAGYIRATAKVNPLKPYIGFGYSGRMTKNNDNWKIGIDAGVMFWGGQPAIYIDRTIETASIDSDTGISSYSYSTETIDMTRDLKDYKNNIKSKMNFIKTLGVYPVINLKISRKLW
jgi:hypothetical protein